jgi:hypothetical protein
MINVFELLTGGLDEESAAKELRSEIFSSTSPKLMGASRESLASREGLGIVLYPAT